MLILAFHKLVDIWKITMFVVVLFEISSSFMYCLFFGSPSNDYLISSMCKVNVVLKRNSFLCNNIVCGILIDIFGLLIQWLKKQILMVTNELWSIVINFQFMKKKIVSNYQLSFPQFPWCAGCKAEWCKFAICKSSASLSEGSWFTWYCKFRGDFSFHY